MNEGTPRELTLTFDVEGNWKMPAAIDFSQRELNLLVALTDVITKYAVEP